MYLFDLAIECIAHMLVCVSMCLNTDLLELSSRTSFRDSFPAGTCVGEFSLQAPSSDSHSVEEVFQVVVKDVLGRVKPLQGEGLSAYLALSRVNGKYVDFQRGTWKHCLCASKSTFKFMMYHEPLFASQISTVSEGPRTQGSTKDPSVAIANLNVDTILVDVSTSLAHSVAIASEAWLSRECPQAAIFQHYIIFNNTLEDLYFGQAGTDEVIMMQVRGCRGYSWKCIHGNHKQVSVSQLYYSLYCTWCDKQYSAILCTTWVSFEQLSVAVSRTVGSVTFQALCDVGT